MLARSEKPSRSGQRTVSGARYGPQEIMKPQQNRRQEDLMQHERQFYIDRQWVDPHSTQTADVVNPTNEAIVGTIVLGDQADVDAAVAAARKAFTHYSQTTVDERAALLERIIDVYTKRIPDLAAVISQEMGAP